MTLAYSFFVGLFVTVFAIAVLSRVATPLGIVDHPGPRKIHTLPVPRVGGIAIALGAMAAILLWMPLSRQILIFLGGSIIIIVTGIWDDIRDLDYRWKLLGQVLGISILLAGGVHFTQLPFFGFDAAPGFVAYTISFLFLLGVTNAFNLFDGLDGLAGGCLGVSIATICILAIVVGDSGVPILGLALIGGILGFLRFNTYPAAVFMGDAGSQFLGFAAGFLSIHLVTDVSSAINSALPILVLGLPLLDTISVSIRRLLQKRSPFKGDRQHLHHRLLARGLSHAQTVSLLYVLQIAMVVTAYFTRYENEIFVMSLFVLFGIAIFAPLYWLEWTSLKSRRPQNGRTHAPGTSAFLSRRIAPFVKYGPHLAAGMVCLFLVVGALSVEHPSKDIAYLCVSVAIVALFGMYVMTAWRLFCTRLSAYVTCAVICFLLIRGGPQASIWDNWPVNIYLALLGTLVVLAVAFSPNQRFRLSPQDLLMMLLVVTVPNLNLERYFEFPLGIFLLQVSLLFYAVEYVLSTPSQVKVIVPVGACFALLIVAMAGYL